MKKRVLVVDDEQDLRDLMSELLGESFEIFTAENGKAAIELTQKIRPDCIVTDYNMPGMDGIEYIKSLYEVGTDIPIIVLTGRGNMRVQHKSLAFDVFEYMEKPFDATVLTETVNRAIQFKKTGTENNAFSRVMFEDIHLKIPKPLAKWMHEQAKARGLSVSSMVEEEFFKMYGDAIKDKAAS